MKINPLSALLQTALLVCAVGVAPLAAGAAASGTANSAAPGTPDLPATGSVGSPPRGTVSQDGVGNAAPQRSTDQIEEHGTSYHERMRQDINNTRGIEDNVKRYDTTFENRSLQDGVRTFDNRDVRN